MVGEQGFVLFSLFSMWSILSNLSVRFGYLCQYIHGVSKGLELLIENLVPVLDVFEKGNRRSFSLSCHSQEEEGCPEWFGRAPVLSRSEAKGSAKCSIKFYLPPYVDV